MLYLKKCERLLNAIQVKFEVFLPEVSYGPAFEIVGDDIKRNQISIDPQDIVGLFATSWEYLSRALRAPVRLLCRNWNVTCRMQENDERQEADHFD